MNFAERLLTPANAADKAPPSDAARAQALGAFLRARRESLDPKRIGLPNLGRRRTPGLRRDDVAQLAEISVTWYTRLEQGRADNVSAKVLNAVAVALQCTATETRHLFALAGLDRQHTALAPQCEHLSAAGQIILAQLNPYPALIQNARFDIIGYNRAFRQLMGVDLAALPAHERNCIHLALTHPVWRAALVDRAEMMPRLVALFRAEMAEHLNEPLWQAQLARFCAVSQEFRDAWQRYEVCSIENQVKRFDHPQLGRLTLQQSNWWTAAKNGDRLLVYLPADEPSGAALQQLAQLPLP